MTTVAEYKAYAGITATTFDARLAVLIPALQDEIEVYCGRRFDTATFTELVSGSGTDAILVRNPPIKTITSITLLFPESATSVYDSTDYAFSLTDDGRIWLWGGSTGRMYGLDEDGNPSQQTFGTTPGFPEGRENVQVIYVGGYGTGTIAMPPSLKLFLWRLLDRYLAQTRQDQSLTSETLGRYTYTRAAPQAQQGAASNVFTPEEMAQMNAWRRVP